MAFLVSIIKPLAYLSVPIVFARAITSSSPTGRYCVNVGIYVGTIVLVSAWGAAVGIVMFVARQRFDLGHFVSRCFYAIASRLFSIQVVIEGEEYFDTRPAVLMANHQSMLDVLVLGRIFPRNTSIMAKKELKWTPLGPFMGFAGALFIDRGNSASAIRSLGEATDTMKRNGSSLWMFPEGTRSSSEIPSMLPLKKGGFHLAVQAGIPIVPVVVENYWWLYHPGVFSHGTIKVRVLPPIQTTGLTTSDVLALSNRVRDQMLDTLRRISVKVPEPKEKPEEPTPPSAPEPAIAPSITVPTHTVELVSSSVVEEAPTEPSSPSPSTTGSVRSIRRSESENGTETEEDEGMVLVGHPSG